MPHLAHESYQGRNDRVPENRIGAHLGRRHTTSMSVAKGTVRPIERYDPTIGQSHSCMKITQKSLARQLTLVTYTSSLLLNIVCDCQI